MDDYVRCANANCPIHGDCLRFSAVGLGYMAYFRPERRRDHKIWCQMFKPKKEVKK